MTTHGTAARLALALARSAASQWYCALTQHVPVLRALYTDNEFPPDKNSLCNNDFTTKKTWSKYVWRRAGHLRKGTPNVFGEISPREIVQGVLGNYHLMSALSCLAEDPDSIKRLFLSQDVAQVCVLLRRSTKELVPGPLSASPRTYCSSAAELMGMPRRGVSPQGKYAIQLHKAGKPVTVVIDDFVPCRCVSHACRLGCRGGEIFEPPITRAHTTPRFFSIP